MNTLSRNRKAQIVRCLIEGNSVRATCRITGTSKDAVLKLLEEIGQACWEYQHDTLRGLTCKRVQCDEIWQFVRMKEKTAKRHGIEEFGVGDVWTFVAIDADTKLVPCWRVGPRDAGTAYELMLDLADRVTHRIQLTTDGFGAYLSAVPGAFGYDIDYAMLVKLYGKDPNEPDHRYSPAKCIGAEAQRIIGFPDRRHISTSYIERQNLNMRMSMRRFTRLTNGFSKKLANHAYMIALYYMWYNFGRVHQTLRVTPAMEAGVANHIWEIEEVVDLLPVECRLS